MTTATPIYRAIMLELEARRLALGFPMEKFSDYAGLPDRYYSKALHVDEPSGRQAQWATLQVIVDALFPSGFDVTIAPRAGAVLTADNLKAKLLRLQADKDPKSRRVLMRELAARVTPEARKLGRAKIPRWKRRRIARAAARARHKKAALHKRADAGTANRQNPQRPRG